MAKRVNVNADYAYQIDVTIRNPAGDLVTPTVGQVTNITVRFSETRTGVAIHASLDALPATETTTPGRFAYMADAALQQEHLLPLGHGAKYYAIWSKAGDMDMEAVEFRVSDGNVN